MLSASGIAKPVYRAFELLHQTGDTRLGTNVVGDERVGSLGKRVCVVCTHAFAHSRAHTQTGSGAKFGHKGSDGVCVEQRVAQSDNSRGARLGNDFCVVFQGSLPHHRCSLSSFIDSFALNASVLM